MLENLEAVEVVLTGMWRLEKANFKGCQIVHSSTIEKIKVTGRLQMIHADHVK